MTTRTILIDSCQVGVASMTMSLAAFLLASAVASLPSQVQAQANGIYTCIDSKGRKLTSDRPIPECSDRDQKVFSPSGTFKGNVGPALSPQELAQQEEKEKALAQERARKDEEKRRDRALLQRYPNKGVHDVERAEALKQIGVVKAAAANRVEELKKQRVGVDEEMEYYKKDPSKAPLRLRRQIEENAESLAVQARFIIDQEGEIKRVNARFDEELARLKLLWPLRSATAAASAPTKVNKAP
jgi:hypothetical protein